MANTIKIKRGSGSDPAASDMVLGEPVLRTDTAELFFKKDDGSVAKVSGGGGGPDFKYLALRNAANNGAASYPNADFTLVTSGTTNAKIPSAANTLLVSVNGVIQKPNTGTSTPSAGFAISGSTIKFAVNISAAPDFILYQESGGIGEPSDETVSEAKLQVSNSPVNGYFLSAQSGNTGGLTWAAPVATSCTGNSATATALATARTINGTSFDGTANITVTAAAGTLSGTTLNSSVVTSSLTSLGDLSGLTVTGDVVIADSIIHSGDTDTKIRFSSANRVSVETAGTEKLAILHDEIIINETGGDFDLRIEGDAATNLIKIDAGNDKVGINTSAPEEKLHVGGAIVTTGSNNTTSTSGSNRSILDFTGGGTRIGHFRGTTSAGSGSLKFFVDSSEKMQINSNGAVVVGGTLQASTNGGLNVEVTDSGNERVPLSLINQGTANGSGVIISHRGKDDAGNQQDYNYIRMVADDTSSGSEDGSIRFWTLGSGTLGERLRIDSSGKVIVKTGHLNLENATATNSRHFSITNAAGTTGWTFGNGVTASSHQFVIYDNTVGAARMLIDSSGNLGIGTTSPSTKLHVNGTVTATAYAGDGSNLTGISAGATGGGSDEIFYENSQTITTDYTITSNKNAMSAGPITINNGVSVTVPSGSTYTIV